MIYNNNSKEIYEMSKKNAQLDLLNSEQELIKKRKEEKKLKLQNTILNYSPSEFAYGFEGCKKCYYDKKINNIEFKSFFPPIFNTFDKLQKNYFNGKNSKLIDNSVEEGVIVADYEKIIKTKVFYDLKKRPFTMSGKIDAYIKHKNGFSVIDFKTTNINESKIDLYETQLQSYALMLENSNEKSLSLSPVIGLGILCFEPNEITNQNKNLADMKWYTKWYKINLDKTHKKIITYITKIQDFLLDGEKPMPSEKCNVCNFLKKQSYL